MDTLHERLAELADEAPTGGAPPAELWARGKRAQRLRAAAVAATVLVVGAVGAGIGVRLADGGRDGSDPEPAGTVDISLPIEYPIGRELPELGDAPGSLAAIWVTPRAGGGKPEVVGLVAETGTFGTLPIDLRVDVQYAAADPGVALSPDGRMIAYERPGGELVAHDLVSGRTYSADFEFKIRSGGGFWIDATHLVGHAVRSEAASQETGVERATDVDGWVWEPGTAPKLVNLGAYPGQPYLGYGWPYGGKDLLVLPEGPRLCETQRIQEAGTEDPQAPPFEVPVLCDVVGVVGSEILLGHWKPESSSGDANDPKYANGAVVALDIAGADPAFEDPARRHVVVTAGAPHRVAFATDLIAEALDAQGGAS
ncbi:hypothetical protein SFC88_06035 [Nocardioides sp. HM23]|uniref:hypothetical protein n=1 Tax=Nocardioides bizhenqiangii TaxID=3095076 RepID=UPI002ACABA41|nr:hypothetical protein [Nocardioides sp. HM23]MDZ5620371.1 hypothetical protein [Nocardioides sp. HM23]